MEDFAKENADTRILIADELRKQNRRVAWLAEEAKLSRQHLGRILKFERPLSEAMLKKINDALQTDFPLRVVTLNN